MVEHLPPPWAHLPAAAAPGVSAGTVLARGVALGLGAAVPIGPVNVQIARRTLRRGFFAGFALGCGAVTADITYAVLSSLSFARLLNRPRVVQVVGAAGVVLLAYLAASCFRAAARAWRFDPISAPAPPDGSGPNPGPAAGRAGPASGARSGYVTGLLMTLLNPMTLAFWFTVVPATTAAAGAPLKPTQESARALPITCAGVFIGTVAWVVAFSGLLTWAGRSRRNGWLAAADAAGGVTLLAFAAVGVWRLARPYL